MEKKSERKKPTLRWENLGPELPFGGSEEMDGLIRTHGEIRVRYVAHLTWGMHQYDDPVDWMEGIRQGLAMQWISGELTRLWSAPLEVESFLIPWVDLYFPKATQRQKEVLSRVCHAQALVRFVEEGPIGIWSDGIIQDEEIVTLCQARVLRLRYRLHPDLSYPSVLQWLSFVVNGRNDPQLVKSFEKHRPDLRVKNFRDYAAAWQLAIATSEQAATPLLS